MKALKRSNRSYTNPKTPAAAKRIGRNDAYFPKGNGARKRPVAAFQMRSGNTSESE